jgi:arylsulfatase A-like enzyme
MNLEKRNGDCTMNKLFVKSIGVVALITVLFCIQYTHAEVLSRPNILLIFIDDMGWKDLGCYGSDFYKTPHIDNLAKEGMRFTQAYAAAHVCSPTRASIVTGKYPARLRLTDWIPGHHRKNAKLLIPQWQKQLPAEEITVGELLQQNGYRTAWLGKWHLRGLPDYAKLRKNKDPRVLKPQQSHGFQKGIQDWKLNSDKSQEDPKGVFQLTNEAIDFIKEAGDNPWFVAVSHYSVHGPVRFNDEVRKKYKQSMNPEGLQKDAAYAAMIESLDQSVGKLMNFIKNQKLDKNTLVVFYSDNGGVAKRTNNAPLRSGKGTLYEGGIRVPCIVSWPGKIPQGVTSDAMISSIDFFPTFARVASVAELPANVDGIDLMEHLTTHQAIDRDTTYWHYPHYHNGLPGSAIRKGDYKLIEFFEDGKLELYDLKNDIGETRDLAKENPEVAKKLHQQLIAWRKSVGAQMMTPNPNYREN